MSLRPRYWQQLPFWKGGKSWADWELDGARLSAVVLVGLSCSEFDIRSIGLLISINAGIQNAAHTNRVQTLKGRLVEAESRTQLRGKLNSSAGCPTSLSDLTEFVWNQRTSRCGAS